MISYMRLFLARHGRSNYNDLGLCNADPSVDVHITKLGTKQALLLADKLKDQRFDAIFISELQRTEQTAEIVNQFHDVKIEIDKRLNDIKTGYEGKPVSEYYAALEAVPDKWTARFNDGESWEDSKKRANSFMEDLKRQPYDTVLIVTSEAIIQLIRSLVDQLSYQQALDLHIKQGTFIDLNI